MKYSRREILRLGIQGAAVAGAAGIFGDRLLSQAVNAAAATGGKPMSTAVIDTSKSPAARLRSLGVNDFDITGGFWKPKILVNHSVSIPHQYDECERTARIDNFRYASGEKDCGHKGFIFNDSDVYKWAEAAAWDLSARPDAKLQAELDEFIRLVAKSQQTDGYLNTAFMGDATAKRWKNLRDEHELYCGGHMIQGAVAHYRTTAGTKFLDVAVKWADLVCSRFGKNKRGTSGHPEIEMALVELARATGDRKYLDQASLFIERRGRSTSTLIYVPQLQDHKPIRKQVEMTGHAVRQLYLLSGIADVFAENSDPTLLEALEKQWENFTGKRMYVTGGAGSRYEYESFGDDYELPNKTAYCETCAAIASFMWNWRMLQLTADPRYADTMETVIYNGVLSGVSLDGKNYYYTNPLEHDGGKDLAEGYRGSNRRTSKHWDGCACCPPNMARTLASLSSYFHGISRDGKTLCIHHYCGGTAVFTTAGAPVSISQKTDFPWDGRVLISITAQTPAQFTLSLRIPNWAAGASAKVNGDAAASATPGTYLDINRTWKTGDTVALDLPMSVRRILPHPKVTENTGKTALARGPIVYCVEGVDFKGANLWDVSLPESAKLDAAFEKDLLGGVTTLNGEAKAGSKKVAFRAVPYFSWANREPGAMRVWIPTA